MLLNIIGWYSFIMLVISIFVIIGRDGKKTVDYTGVFKVVTIIVNAPVLYFVWYCLFKLVK